MCILCSQLPYLFRCLSAPVKCETVEQSRSTSGLVTPLMRQVPELQLGKEQRQLFSPRVLHMGASWIRFCSDLKCR